MPAPIQLLLVDDDRRLAESMASWLSDQGCQVDLAGSIAAARERLRAAQYQLVILDLRLEDGDGLQLIPEIRQVQNDCEILVVTGYATPDMAVEAVRAGAFDLLTKPLIDEELMLAIERALAHREIEAENQNLREQLDRKFGGDDIVGHDYRMLKIFDVIDSVADARASVLITGENGTGKSMIARAIHRRSNRAARPFVEVACGALPETLLESELFGHVAGAFTGASANKVGKFELAHRGTLFLDEIATASPAMQVKLLRVLQDLHFEAVGGTETREVDVRVILATNENLAAAVREGRFRQDLYYRINVINIELPPLRERAADLPLLVDQFLQQAVEDSGKSITGFHRDAIACMQQYAWPGNVRELENVVERAVLLSRDEVLGVEDLPPQISGQQPSESQAYLGAWPPLSREASPGTASRDMRAAEHQSLRDALEGPERQIILAALRRNEWNRAATADQLQINRTTLYKKMKRLGLDDPRLQFSSV